MQYVVTSDIHLGHRKTPTEHIAKSFRKCILDNKHKDSKVIFISGDLFDRLLETNSRDILIILELMDQLLNFCYQHSIKLRVLEGTPSHDWNQSQILPKLNDMRIKNRVDLKYFKVLDIEHLAEENKYVLYVPDEWVNCHEELERQIEEKLKHHAISQVDIAIMHGQFQYQFAGIPYTGFHFQENYFLNLVKGFIHVGHYHNYTSFDRIIANGSLERLAHRQEEDKGYVVVNNDSYEFITNPDAYIYKTIAVTKRTTLTTLDKQILGFPHNSYIRLQMTRDHPFNINFNDIKLRYLDYHMERRIKDDESASSSVTDILSDDDLDNMSTFAVDTNIKQTLEWLVKSKYDLSDSEETRLIHYLQVFNDLEEPTADI